MQLEEASTAVSPEVPDTFTIRRVEELASAQPVTFKRAPLAAIVSTAVVKFKPPPTRRVLPVPRLSWPLMPTERLPVGETGTE